MDLDGSLQGKCALFVSTQVFTIVSANLTVKRPGEMTEAQFLSAEGAKPATQNLYNRQYTLECVHCGMVIPRSLLTLLALIREGITALSGVCDG